MGTRAVGRESEAHPAFRIIPSSDAERHHPPPTQGDKYRIVRNGERPRPDTMQVIGENDNGLDSERSTLTGRLENRPKIVKVFGQEFPAAFQ